MNSESVERIELKIAYLERAAHELSDVVYRQQREIEALRVQLRAAVERIAQLATPERAYTLDEEKPPHY